MSSKYLSFDACLIIVDKLDVIFPPKIEWSNYQLVSIYDKRFFVSRFWAVFYQDKNNGAH